MDAIVHLVRILRAHDDAAKISREMDALAFMRGNRAGQVPSEPRAGVAGILVARGGGAGKEQSGNKQGGETGNAKPFAAPEDGRGDRVPHG